MTKTYGRLGWATNKAGLPYFGMQVVPHVAIKAKRLFPKIDQGRTDMLMILDTTEVAADIEWFLMRYPLDMAPEVAERLASRAAEWRGEQSAIERILDGRADVLGNYREPARPGRDYQITGAQLAYQTGGLLLGDELGLGKTQTALMMLADPRTLPALLVVPTHLPTQWERECKAVWPDLRTHIITSGKPYKIGPADVVITSYSKLAKWRDYLGQQIKTVIFDEVQDLRRDGSDKYDAAAHIADNADRRMGLSASPIYNYGGEAFNIYEVLKPGVLGTRSEFFREWGGSTASNGQIVVKDPNALGQYLRDQGLLLRRTRAEVGRQLPEPVLPIIEVQSRGGAVEQVTADMVAMAERVLHGTREERFQASGQIELRMRQATGIDKAPFVAEFAKTLLESEPKIVMFGWHRTVYDIWNNALSDYNPVMYTGSETPARKNASVQKFLTDDRCRIFICSLRSGAGLDGLQEAASVAVFGELDWSPAMHHQAVGRLAREGQPNSVVGYFLVSTEGTDPLMRGVLEKKRQQAEPLMSGDQALFVAQSEDTEKARSIARMILAKAGRAVD